MFLFVLQAFTQQRFGLWQLLLHWQHTEQQYGHLSSVTFGRHEAGTSRAEPGPKLPWEAGEAGGGRKEQLPEAEEDTGEREEPWKLE